MTHKPTGTECAASKGAAHSHLRTLTLLFLALLLGSSAVRTAAAQQAPAQPWELRVCADRQNLPFSDSNGDGFENRLMEIIADELGATVVNVWTPDNHNDTDAQLMLRYGECDVVPSINDGQEPFLPTVSYYTATSKFVTVTGSGSSVTSLDDPLLPTLRIGVNRASPVDLALLSRVDIDHVRHYQWSDAPDAPIQDLLNGDIDLAIVRGAVADYYKTKDGLPIDVLPVTPGVDIPFLVLTQAVAMGVRRGDTELRDLLNAAIWARRNDIGAVLDEFGLRSDLATMGANPEPPARENELRLGVVLPVMTGMTPRFSGNIEGASDALVRAAQLAAELAARDESVDVRLYLAAAPDAPTAERSARRLIQADGVAAVLGGVGPGQSTALATVAGELKTPFINIADPDAELRHGLPYVFNVAPSVYDYASAMAAELATAAEARVLMVASDEPASTSAATELHTCLQALLPEGWSADLVTVPSGVPFYGPVMNELADLSATHLILVMSSTEELVLASQLESSRTDVTLLAMPTAGSQVRQHYWSLMQDAPSLASQVRLASWDSSLEASAYAEAYLGRWGERPDGVSWGGYEGVLVLAESAARLFAGGATAVDSAALQAALADAAAAYDLGLDGSVSFDPATNQLRAPVYAVELTRPPADEKYATAELARVVGTYDGGRTCTR